MQKSFGETPTYECLEEIGPAHHKKFRFAVLLKEQKLAEGEGESKKEAQQNAAKEALARIKKEGSQKSQ